MMWPFNTFINSTKSWKSLFQHVEHPPETCLLLLHRLSMGGGAGHYALLTLLRDEHTSIQQCEWQTLKNVLTLPLQQCIMSVVTATRNTFGYFIRQKLNTDSDLKNNKTVSRAWSGNTYRRKKCYILWFCLGWLDMMVWGQRTGTPWSW